MVNKDEYIYIRTLYYIQGAWGDEIIFAVLCVTLLWALHSVIKQQFFYINSEISAMWQRQAQFDIPTGSRRQWRWSGSTFQWSRRATNI